MTEIRDRFKMTKSKNQMHQNSKALKEESSYLLDLFKRLAYLLMVILAVWFAYSLLWAKTDWSRMASLKQMAIIVSRFFPPNMSFVLTLLKPTIETFMIAVLGTVLAVILSIPVSYLSARNITPYFPLTYPIGRFIMTISRSVHEIVWGLIFVAALGLGPFPGIMAIAMRSIGFLSKLTAEEIENVNIGPIEAIEATGASKAQVILYGIIPQILHLFIGNAIFQWDINIRRATIIGLVGAGGIGIVFSIQMAMYNYRNATATIVAILILVIFGEYVSNRLRMKVI
jgi:phosphonate transport system permease protein